MAYGGMMRARGSFGRAAQALRENNADSRWVLAVYTGNRTTPICGLKILDNDVAHPAESLMGPPGIAGSTWEDESGCCGYRYRVCIEYYAPTLARSAISDPILYGQYLQFSDETRTSLAQVKYIDLDQTVELRWRLGTLSAGERLPDGYVEARVNGLVVGRVDGIRLGPSTSQADWQGVGFWPAGTYESYAANGTSYGALQNGGATSLLVRARDEYGDGDRTLFNISFASSSDLELFAAEGGAGEWGRTGGSSPEVPMVWGGKLSDSGPVPIGFNRAWMYPVDPLSPLALDDTDPDPEPDPDPDPDPGPDPEPDPDPDTDEPPPPRPTPTPTPTPNCCADPNPPTSSDPNPDGPAPGANPGGVGWTPQCDGGGEVGTYPVADAGESMAGVRTPRLSLEVAFRTYDAENVEGDDTARWSVDQTLPDAPGYYGGRKDGRMLRVSRIARGVSDDNGQYVGSSVEVSVNDKDRAALRARLGSATGKYVWEREGIFRLVSEAGRRAHVTPRELMRGVSRGIALENGFKGTIRFEDILTTQIGKFGPDRTFPTRLLTRALCGAADLVDKPQQWIFGEVSDHGAVDPVTGLESARGLVPTWCIGQTTHNGAAYDIFHLAAHACVSYELFGTDGAEQQPRRVLLDLTALRAAGTILLPEDIGPTPYLDLPDADTGKTHRVVHFMVRSDSIYAEAHKSGGPSIAANVCGVEDVGDGSGVLITDLFRIYQFIFEHLVLPTEEYHTGLYAGSPQWADGRYLIHSDSFADAQTYSAQRIGGRGYQGGFVLGGPGRTPVTLRELLRRESNSGDCWFTWSHGGQLKVVLMDDTADVTATRIFREPVHIRDFPSPSYDESAVENPVLFQYDYDEDGQKFRVEQEKAIDPIAIGRMGGREKPSDSPVAMRCTRDANTARDVAQRRLLRRKYPPAYYPVELPLDGCDVEPGEVIRISSQEGPGTGCDLMPLFVTDWSYEHEKRRAVLKCRDLTDILAPASVLVDVDGDTSDDDLLLVLRDDPADPDIIVLR